MKPYLHIVDREGGSISLPCPETRGAKRTGTSIRRAVILDDVLILLRQGRDFLSLLTVQLLADPSSLKGSLLHGVICDIVYSHRAYSGYDVLRVITVQIKLNNDASDCPYICVSFH